MMQQDKSAAPTTGLSVQNNLGEASMPSSNRTGVISRAMQSSFARGATLFAALTTNSIPAEAQTKAQAEPTPIVAPLNPGIPVISPEVAQQVVVAQGPAQGAPAAAPVPATATPATSKTTQTTNEVLKAEIDSLKKQLADLQAQLDGALAPSTDLQNSIKKLEKMNENSARRLEALKATSEPAATPAPAVDISRSNITVLEKRPFCMTDEGKVLLIGDRESQVKRPGSFVEGSPSTGTALQALAYAKEHLLEMNGGKIPEGYQAKLYIRSGGAESSSLLNLNAIPAVGDLGPTSHGIAKNDPLTGQAIQMIHNGVNVRVKNDGGAFTMTFKNKSGNAPLLMTVELEKAAK